MLSSVTVKAPAKLNLSLDIIDSGDDDYHLMKTIMQSVDLCDTVTVTKNNANQINFTCNNEDVSKMPINLACKAAELFFKTTNIKNCGVNIDINKIIPINAGLAGGSADAAGVFVGLDKLYKTNISLNELCMLGLKLGADVPFCLKGGTQLAEGIGEIFTPLPQLPECYFVIVKPSESILTKDAFECYDKFGAKKRPDIEGVIAGIVAGNLEELALHMYNVFEDVICVDKIRKIKELLLKCEALGAGMTGSGTAVFGIFDNKYKARRCIKIFLFEKYKDVFFTTPLHEGARVVKEI